MEGLVLHVNHRRIEHGVCNWHGGANFPRRIEHRVCKWHGEVTFACKSSSNCMMGLALHVNPRQIEQLIGFVNGMVGLILHANPCQIGQLIERVCKWPGGAHVASKSSSN